MMDGIVLTAGSDTSLSITKEEKARRKKHLKKTARMMTEELRGIDHEESRHLIHKEVLNYLIHRVHNVLNKNEDINEASSSVVIWMSKCDEKNYENYY